MADGTQQFKVIIVGGSLVGLTAALALEKGGIDFLVLEKREVAPSIGASISIHPHVQRVMEQLGVWPEIRAGVTPLQHRQHYDQHGRLFADSAVLQEISKLAHGRITSFMQREFWLRCIYNQIRDKTRIRAFTGLASFTETEDGVEVTTDGGETIRGDLLLGADGTHSTVRSLLADKIDIVNPSAARQMREGFESKYDCIFATSRNANAKGGQFLPDAMAHTVFYQGFSGVAAAGVPGLVFWFLFVKSDQATKSPNTPRFTEKEVEATMAKYGHHALGPGYTFQDLWDSRVGVAMVPLEEGILVPKWNSGRRTVLVGDAVHKGTPNRGLVGNLAVEGVVHLMNELVPLVRRARDEGSEKPALSDLTAALDRYEQKHRPHSNLVISLSSYTTRYEAMETWWLRICRRIGPWISDRIKANGFISYMKGGPWLNFLPNPDEVKET